MEYFRLFELVTDVQIIEQLILYTDDNNMLEPSNFIKNASRFLYRSEAKRMERGNKKLAIPKQFRKTVDLIDGNPFLKRLNLSQKYILSYLTIALGVQDLISKITDLEYISETKVISLIEKTLLSTVIETKEQITKQLLKNTEYLMLRGYDEWLDMSSSPEEEKKSTSFLESDIGPVIRTVAPSLSELSPVQVTDFFRVVTGLSVDLYMHKLQNLLLTEIDQDYFVSTLSHFDSWNILSSDELREKLVTRLPHFNGKYSIYEDINLDKHVISILQSALKVSKVLLDLREEENELVAISEEESYESPIDTYRESDSQSSLQDRFNMLSLVDKKSEELPQSPFGCITQPKSQEKSKDLAQQRYIQSEMKEFEQVSEKAKKNVDTIDSIRKEEKIESEKVKSKQRYSKIQKSEKSKYHTANIDSLIHIIRGREGCSPNLICSNFSDEALISHIRGKNLDHNVFFTYLDLFNNNKLLFWKKIDEEICLPVISSSVIMNKYDLDDSISSIVTSISNGVLRYIRRVIEPDDPKKKDDVIKKVVDEKMTKMVESFNILTNSMISHGHVDTAKAISLGLSEKIVNPTIDIKSDLTKRGNISIEQGLGKEDRESSKGVLDIYALLGSGTSPSIQAGTPQVEFPEVKPRSTYNLPQGIGIGAAKTATSFNIKNYL